MAGKDWLSNFIARSPKFSLRQPEATSLARASGFNEVVVAKFFDLLRELYSVYQFPSPRFTM